MQILPFSMPDNYLIVNYDMNNFFLFVCGKIYALKNVKHIHATYRVKMGMFGNEERNLSLEREN